MRLRPVTIALLTLSLLASSPNAPAASNARDKEKMTAEQVVARHLEAVGAPETRASITARVITGVVVANFRAPSVGQVPGRAVFFSQGAKHAVGMVFDGVANYPHDKIGFDGEDVSTSYVLPGRRSTLGEFLMTNKSVIKQGLLGGALSQAWPLLDLASKKPKLEYGGLKKVGERPAHALKYLARGGSDLNVTLFFDAETFQHLRTEYTRSLSSQMGTNPNNSARQIESRYRMVEDFADFRKEGGLTLPHQYKLGLEITLPGGSYRMEWDFALSNFAYNQPIDPKSFDVDDKAGE
ncbi:MAG TPA: hypothetical protein VF591_12495 [Pyrinomonadaceae bacterium]|jgi:hypothetical protein